MADDGSAEESRTIPRWRRIAVLGWTLAVISYHALTPGWGWGDSATELPVMFFLPLQPLALAIIAFPLLGPGWMGRVVGRRMQRRDWLLVLLAAVVSLILSFAYPILATATPRDPDPTMIMWAIYLNMAVSGPVVEELLYRGLLWVALWHFVRHPAFLIAVSAALFAWWHQWEGLLANAYLLTFGALVGWLRVRTGSVVAPLAVHVFHNTAAVVGVSLLRIFG